MTGEKQVGKSTLIRRLLENETRKIGGFRTVKTERIFPECSSVHLLQIGAGEEPTEENMLFLCNAPWDQEVAGRFNELGCTAIKGSKDAELLVMDELGPKEVQAEKFRASVLQALDGDVPILGVLQKADSPFLSNVLEHPQVEVVEVTLQNREHLAPALRHWYDRQKDSFGAIVIEKTTKGPMVLMVRTLRGWSFPKGHPEGKELPAETAAREVWEETGIHVAIDTSFSYSVPSVLPGDRRTVTFFLGRSLDSASTPISNEVSDAAWVPAWEAETRICYPADRSAYMAAWDVWKRR